MPSRLPPSRLSASWSCWTRRPGPSGCGGPIAAVLTGSFGGLMRDLLRHDRMAANLRGELYPEIAAVWGLAFAIFLEWEGARLQPEEIRLGVIVTIVGVFLTRIVAIVRGAKGWSYV